MTNRMLMIAMIALGLGLSTVTPSRVSPESVKSITWFISGILSKWFK